MTSARLVTAMSAALFCSPGLASDLPLNAYLAIPLGGSSPFLGFRAGPGAGLHAEGHHDDSQAYRLQLELRYGTERGTVFLVNGFPVARSLILNASDDGEPQPDEEAGFDWRMVGVAILGIGSIYAASKVNMFSNSSANTCSGAGCTPPPNYQSTRKEAPDSDADGGN